MPLNILILGGTSFLGPHLITALLSSNHTITLLNRGTKPAPPGTTQLIGDRLSPDGGLSAITSSNLTFDAVIDTWSGAPSAVTHAVDTLGSRTKYYVYVSSLSVYDFTPKPGDTLPDEDTPLYDVTKPDADKLEYQYNKRSSEITVEKLQSPECGVIIVRPGVILGPREAPIIERGRLTWWLDRLSRGGRTVAPGPRELGLQIVDARDLAGFVVQGLEKGLQGVFNLIGREVTGGGAELVWKTAREIEEAGVGAWVELPLWLDGESEEYGAVYRWDDKRAREAGLRCRDIGETVRDTWEWMKNGESKPEHAPEGYKGTLLGLSKEKEVKLLG
ncbi:reductase [Cercophora newfieldiana]|uniref:Reductase n=1 Tax=Cercophora newfieldiana TaxID=92897 RepID=A0AA40CZG4_9PEZI|nr:reductase [Cercophora newfieldiana]